MTTDDEAEFIKWLEENPDTPVCRPAPMTTPDREGIFKCVNGHDRCYGGAGAGPDCPYCERLPPPDPTPAPVGELSEPCIQIPDDTDWRVVLCESCGSEGRTYRSSGGPDEIDYGPCPYCEGTGGEMIRVEPIEIDDLP
jgi:hypothetical protein